MTRALKILFVTTDLSPFCKAGGLGDVSKSLPKALSKMGHDVRIIMPLHGVIDEKKHNIELVKDNLVAKIDENNEISFRIKKGWLVENLPVYFIDKYKYFRSRSRLYVYKDENQRFMFFCFAVLEAVRNMDSWVPDIIHCNDWHTGLIPYLLKTRFDKEKIFEKTRTLFTIHNLTFQFGRDWWKIDKREQDDGISELPDFSDERMVERINFTKRAIMNADMINTVSEQYAKEIIQEKFGQGLHDILLEKYKEKRFYGIINGIDYREYNPQTDPGLVANYSYNSLDKKIINKRHLQEIFNLEVNDEIPVIAMVTRITEQKGFDLIVEIVDALIRLEMQLVLIGSADSYYRKIFRRLSKKNPKKIATHLEFKTKDITQVYAGSDMFLMPSRFEPCGLGQMISLRYGSVPIVRETGGLSDTITNYNPKTRRGNGFTFKTYDPKDLLVAIVRALENYKYKDVWKELVKKGMQESFTWEVPAKKYVILYRKAMKIKDKKRLTYKPIADIARKMRNLFKKKGFKVIKPVRSFINKKKRFYAHSVLADGKKVFLKARIVDDSGSIIGLEKEMEILKIMTRNKEIAKKVNFTEYLDGSLEEVPEWYTHKYIEGELLGDFYEMPNENERYTYIKSIVKNLLNLQSISTIFIEKAKENGVMKYIKIRSFGDYKDTIDFYKREKVGDGKIDFDSVHNLLEKNKELFNNNLVVSHGDFTLANHIIGRNKKVYLSDWESVRIDNIAADITHLWVQTWRYPKWRSQLLLEFLNSLSSQEKKNFREIFRVVAAEQAMAEIKWNSKLCKRKYKKQVIDISIRTVRAALEGFDELLKM